MFLLLLLPVVGAEEAPMIDEEIKEIILGVGGIGMYDEVLDAAIIQKEEDPSLLSLSLVVQYGTTEESAKELGDCFVRMTKSLSPDDPPGNEIGPGIYDYIIGVFYPNGNNIALGAKDRTARRITW